MPSFSVVRSSSVSSCLEEKERASVQSVHLQFSGSQLLLLLLKLQGDNAKLLSCEIKLSLQLSCLGGQLFNFILTFRGAEPGSLARFLTFVHPITGVILLHLHCLHLLLDGLHVGGESLRGCAESTGSKRRLEAELRGTDQVN